MCVKHDQEPDLRTVGTIERKEVVCGRPRVERLRRTGITSGLKLSFSVDLYASVPAEVILRGCYSSGEVNYGHGNGIGRAVFCISPFKTAISVSTGQPMRCISCDVARSYL
jgi:hypothetical protein